MELLHFSGHQVKAKLNTLTRRINRVKYTVDRLKKKLLSCVMFVNVREISRELGISAQLIYRWRREMSANPSLAFGGNGEKQLTEEQKELAW